MEIFGLITGFAFILAWNIAKVVLAIVVLYVVYQILFEFISFVWNAIHEPSYTYVKGLLINLKSKITKKKVGK